MTTEKRVLLARPHAFIVEQMRPFLLEAGYLPVGAESLDQLKQELGGEFRGAIISTAVSSSVSADAADVFRLVRERWPRMPVAFAGMAEAATMKLVAVRAVKAQVGEPAVALAAEYPLGPSRDRESRFLVLRKEDLIAGPLREGALQALRAHFG